MDTRFAVESRPTVQELGVRRTSFVRRRSVVPRAVEELHHDPRRPAPERTALTSESAEHAGRGGLVIERGGEQDGVMVQIAVTRALDDGGRPGAGRSAARERPDVHDLPAGGHGR